MRVEKVRSKITCESDSVGVEWDCSCDGQQQQLLIRGLIREGVRAQEEGGGRREEGGGGA